MSWRDFLEPDQVGIQAPDGLRHAESGRVSAQDIVGRNDKLTTSHRR